MFTKSRPSSLYLVVLYIRKCSTPLRIIKSSTASNSVNTENFLERKLKQSTEIAIRQQRKANENLILRIMQFVKWVVDSKQGRPLTTKTNCKSKVIPHPKF